MSVTAAKRQDDPSVEDICADVSAGLQREFPLLWEKAEQFDFAERLGGCTDALMAEADGVLHELWMSRTNKRLEALNANA